MVTFSQQWFGRSKCGDFGTVYFLQHTYNMRAINANYLHIKSVYTSNFSYYINLDNYIICGLVGF
jgi:hypothetical protein